jgi:hypothetical protein
VRAENVSLIDLELHGNYATVPQEQRAPLVAIARGGFTVERATFFDSTKEGLSVTAEDQDIVGAAQAGVAMSEHLGVQGIPHLVLERSRIAERWDSLVANGPAWHGRFLGMEFEDFDPDEFVPKEKLADYF